MSDPQIEVLDRFFAAMRAGDFAAWKAELGSEMLAELEEHVPGEEERAAFMEHQRSQAPERFEVVERVPERSELVIRTSRATAGGEQTEHTVVSLAEENGVWRISGLFAAADPATVGAPTDQRAADDLRGEIDDYRLGSKTSMGGPVVRVSYGDEYSLVVIRVLDGEQTVFMPTRPEIEAAGIDPELLVPDAIVEVEGHPHGTDDCKVLGTNLRVLAD